MPARSRNASAPTITRKSWSPTSADLLPAIVRHFDEPFADSSAIPTFAVAQATAQVT